MRNLVAENSLRSADFIYPLFIVEGSGIRREVESMPGVHNFSLDQLPAEIDEIVSVGISCVLLFGIPQVKDAHGSGAYAASGIVQRAVACIKSRAPQLIVVTDVCLCEYTSHGHCGLLNEDRIINDSTVELLTRAAVSHAEAGADIIAPSDMMDLRVASIRKGLDGAGFQEVPIMAYSTKFASAFYGPFRDAAQSTPAFGDRKTHQLNPANSREAMRQAAADLAQGADILMVKPCGQYLDILSNLRQRFDCPLAAYQVSGEYSMIKAAAAQGWIDEARAAWESLICAKRAGADLIITYFAKDILSGRLEYEY